MGVVSEVYIPYGETLLDRSFREPMAQPGAKVYLLWVVMLLDNGDIDMTDGWELYGVYSDLATLKRDCPERGELKRDFAAQEWTVNGQANSEIVWWKSWEAA